MLVQFLVRNFLSFKEETVLDMRAVGAYKEHAYNLIDIGTVDKYLRVVAIYGANASGKSNLYYALNVFRRIVRGSFNNVTERDKSVIYEYYMPFEFDKDRQNTEFEIVTNYKGTEYTYGFEYNSKVIAKEWLYSRSNKTRRTKVIFERSGTEDGFFGVSVKRDCYPYVDQVPEETLYLSFFNKLKLKTDVFKAVYQSIMDIWTMDTDFYKDDVFFDDILKKVIDEDKNDMLTFLAAIDSGIKDIGYEEAEKKNRYYTIHVDENNNHYSIDLYNESEGTLKCMMFYIAAAAVIHTDGVIFVDELNAKLHPLLLKFIIDLFYEKHSQAQLVYTTHDTTLMDKNFFRRDQICFVQKDAYGHSTLCALSDFKVRQDASFEKDYLAGVYGGIPFLKDFSSKRGNS